MTARCSPPPMNPPSRSRIGNTDVWENRGGSLGVATLSYTVAAGDPNIGKNLQIFLDSDGQDARAGVERVAFDNVHLTYHDGTQDFLHAPVDLGGSVTDSVIAKVIDVRDVVGIYDTLTLSLDHLAGDGAENFYIHLWGYVENEYSHRNNGPNNMGATLGNNWESSGQGWDQYNLIGDFSVKTITSDNVAAPS